MKDCLILRHAKAAYLDSDFEDFDRPLTLSGRQSAFILGERLKEEKIFPDSVMCSTARRARETLEAVGKFFPEFTPISYEDDLYLASVQLIYAKLAGLDDRLNSVLIVGHNPGLEQLLVSLAPEDILLKHTTPLVSASFVHLELNIDHWRQIKKQTGQVKNFFPPSELQ